MNPDIQQGKLILNNLLINYYYNEAQNPLKTLIFLHGWRSNSTLWFKIFPELLQNYQIYAVDLPGFGQSQVPTTPFTLQDYVDVATSFIQKLSLKKPILIGHSHGGRVGIKLSAAQPELLEKLVLVDSAGIKNDSTDVKLKKGVAKLVKPIFKLPFMKPVREKIYQKMGAEDYVATPEMTQTFLNVVNEDLSSLLSQIKIETLIIWGENDIDTPISFAHTMNEQIPHSKLAIIKDAAHYSFLDQPEEFLKPLKNFIQER
ncbi:MAG: alpha/beta hydrolase [Patescibacteria group bacterium]